MENSLSLSLQVLFATDGLSEHLKIPHFFHCKVYD